ncbi:uncharacterized protein LOC131636780 [Vicia villosa]|uniref:uncharacterized protein LOC131601493 n=1 Tax=Vicia villosa TaxID=3911 RepID=UPI00273B24BB|nr:uncharacterized protein LOC131601493 [Vicia villosa]XP_058763361.1 uncharacterized protein LOC131636780 [Vicia villosa]
MQQDQERNSNYGYCSWGRLPTKDRLQRFGIITESTCVFCPAMESIDHLFFQCKVSAAIWHRMLQWLGYSQTVQNWNVERVWLIKELSKKGWRRLLLKMILAETTYAIWRARNDIVFNNTPMDQASILDQIQHIVYIRGRGYKKLQGHVESLRRN